MRFIISLICASFFWTQSVAAASYTFDIVARIDSAFLFPPNQNAAPAGGTLYGQLTYSDPPSIQWGPGDYQYAAGLESFSIWTDEGFSLSLSTQYVTFGSFSSGDAFSAQSFVSEDPNGWNMFMDLLAADWLPSSGLPTVFPDTFDYGYISAYFLDEGDMIQTLEATVLSITLASVPLPSSAAFAGITLCAAGFMFRRRRKT